MKKDYLSPEFDIMKIRFDSMMASQHVVHSVQEDFSDGGEEGPDE